MDKELLGQKSKQEEEISQDGLNVYINLVVDIMRDLEIGTTDGSDGLKEIGKIVEDLIKRDGGLKEYEIPEENVVTLAATLLVGYDYFGAAFLDKVLESKKLLGFNMICSAMRLLKNNGEKKSKEQK